MASRRYLAGGATIRLDDAPLGPRLVTRFWNGISRCQKLMAGSFIFVRTAEFRETGGFSLEYFAGEELELSERLKKIARARHLKIAILHRHPIKTSARKVKLYTPREMGGILFGFIFNHRKLTGSREAAYMWYDGRR